MNVQSFTDRDLDGAGCGVVIEIFEEALGNKVYTRFVDRLKIGTIVQDFLNNHADKFDKLIITDMGVPLETAKLIDSYISNRPDFEVVLRDHHDTNKFLNRYSWAEVISERVGRLTSGTELITEYYNKSMNDKTLFSRIYWKLYKFVELVTEYDTYRWYKNKNFEAYDLSIACSLMGLELFKNNIKTNIKNGEDLINIELRILVNRMRDKEDIFIKKKLEKVHIIEIQGYVAGIVFIDSFTGFISILGNKICEKYPEIDVALMIDLTSGKVDLRSNKNDVHLGKWAEKYFGGGGHAKAAGFTIKNDKVFTSIIGILQEYLNS